VIFIVRYFVKVLLKWEFFPPKLPSATKAALIILFFQIFRYNLGEQD